MTSDEVSLIQEFYEKELKTQTANYILQIFQRMFKKVKNETLKNKYLINVAISKPNKFEFLCSLVQAVCKCTEEEEEIRFRFLFDVFSNYSTHIKRNQIKDFCEIFKVPL